jgi:DEAD/DEAH box helicase domain-containing protein
MANVVRRKTSPPSRDSPVLPDDPDLNELKKIHKSLATIYTFLVSSGRHIATTFEVLKPSVDRDIARSLTVADLAKIKFLVPDDVVFQYMDENQVNLEAGPVTNRQGFVASERDVFSLDIDAPKQLLMFEFIDGTVKPEKKKVKTIKPSAPSFAVVEIKKMIDKRLYKFSLALADFYIKCERDHLPFGPTLDTLSQVYIPKQRLFEDPVEMMVAARDDQVALSGNIASFVSHVRNFPTYCDQIVDNGEFYVPERNAKYGDVQLSPQVAIALEKARDITKLYSHQSEAIEAVEAGCHVIVTTSTSSGKSLIYQLPVLSALERDMRTTAMYIFPTKALAQDQKRSFVELLSATPFDNIVCDTYDGDTPISKRTFLRENASVIFTNPDMIHYSILPSWDLWRSFLRNLRFIVVDELHIYCGLFGAHVALIMRRLLRICEELGNTTVQIISCSATVRNPTELMKSIFGVTNVTLIDEDGSPVGERTYLVWNCPYVSPNDQSSGRLHPVSEATELMIELMSRGIRTIAFCRVRRTCELLMKSIRKRLENDGDTKKLLPKVMSYRGGYSVEDRRRIEKEMFDGHLLGIVATNALELGIDVGSLDAVLVVGFPFSISNVRQQIGRAGRRNKESLAILIGSGSAIDQYYMSNPRALLDAPDADVPIALDNVLVLEGHLQCAAQELPVRVEDCRHFSLEQNSTLWTDLVQNRLEPMQHGMFTCHPRFAPRPSTHVHIRGIQDEDYAVVDTTNDRNVVVETVEASRTPFTLYEGGIFLHQGHPYLIQEVKPDMRYAKVTRVDVDWITRQRDYTDVDPIETEIFQKLTRVPYTACFGKIRHASYVFGFFKVDNRNRILDAVEVDCAPLVYESKGFWIDVPALALKVLKERQLCISGAIHGAEHAILSLFPNFISTVPGEVSTECKAPEKEYAGRQSSRKRPARLIFCDRSGGEQGCGLSLKAFEFVNELLDQAVSRVKTCNCEYGCPECVASTSCREHSEIISKSGAFVILSILAGQRVDVKSIPFGPEPNLLDIRVETVIPAVPVKTAKGAMQKMK